jgi:hypothetical protein
LGKDGFTRAEFLVFESGTDIEDVVEIVVSYSVEKLEIHLWDLIKMLIDAV